MQDTPSKSTSKWYCPPVGTLVMRRCENAGMPGECWLPPVKLERFLGFVTEGQHHTPLSSIGQYWIIERPNDQETGEQVEEEIILLPGSLISTDGGMIWKQI